MIDSHIHLTHEKYEDIDTVIKIAKQSGVTQVVSIGCNYEEFKRVLKLKKQYPDFIHAAIGWHPVEVKTYKDEYLAFVEQEIIAKNICAIGEIGLDYHWYPEEKELQIQVFEDHLKLAKKYDFPIIIHAREAYDDTYEILKKYAPIKGIMHSFASDEILAQKFIDIGLEIGISGPITFKNGQSQKDVAKNIDLEKLHIETDGPYLTPVPYRGKTNQPEYIKYVAQEIAFQKDISLDDVLSQTEKNTIRLFNLEGKNV